MRRDAALPEVGQQLVQLDDQEALVRHRVQVAVQAVDDDHRRAVLLDRVADRVRRTRRATARPDRPAAR